MRLSIPTYVETVRRPGNRNVVYRCRPLLHCSPESEHYELGRATARLADSLVRSLTEHAGGGNEKELARYHFDAPVPAKTVRLRLDLRSSLPEVKYLIAQLPINDRKIMFSPCVPDVWFDVSRGESMIDRATQVYSQHFRRQMRCGDALPSFNSIDGKAWVTTVEIDVQPRQQQDKEKDHLAALFGCQTVDGEEELHRVGRSLKERDPEDLSCCVHLVAEVEEVLRLLDAPDRRPIALVGPPMVGKSAMLHEIIRRWGNTQGAELKRKRKKQDIWLVNPQRLVSGMQFVGQWEQRVLAILKFAAKAKQVLWFDDVPGLYHAGVTRDSKLSVADVLREHLCQSKRARLVFELTPEQLAKISETDRRLADILHYVRISEPDDLTVTKVLIASQAQLESKHACTLTPDVIPLVMDLTRRHERTAAQPGKSVRLLEELAVRHAHGRVDRVTVLQQFHRKTGISLDLIDDTVTLEREGWLSKLRQMVIGQYDATSAVVDVAVRAKSHLADPARPLATMLFLGPTGVGKTHCAESMAQLFFGSASNLIRLDMNEFASPASVTRLIGSPIAPDGLLTGPVLARPHSVILLDEIEKVHPDVLDLLLQVLGEGRLTDQRGRTADFTQCVLVMTSNLGTQQAAHQIQINRGGAERSPIKVAEKFFRPEFFNRIDHIVAFEHLHRSHILQIVDLMLREVFSRDGFARRRCLMEVDPQVRYTLAQSGFDSTYGARALRRVIEQQLCSPIAERLSQISLDSPALVRMVPGDECMISDVVPLRECERQTHATESIDEVQSTVQSMLDRVEGEIDRRRPASTYTVGTHDPRSLQYYALSDLFGQVRDQLSELQSAVHNHVPETSDVSRHRARRSGELGPRILKEVAANDDVNSYLDEMAQSPESPRDSIRALSNSAALLSWFVSNDECDSDLQGVLWYRTLDGNNESDASLLSENTESFASQLIAAHRRLFGSELGLDVTTLFDREQPTALSISGAGTRALASRESGIHLVIGPGQLSGIRVDWIPTIAPVESWGQFVEYGPTRWESWLDQMRRGEASMEDEPIAPGQVLRIYHIQSSTGIDLVDVHDLRTGQKQRFQWQCASLLNLFMDALPRLSSETPECGDA